MTERDARTHAHYLLARAAENVTAAQRCLDSQRWSAAAAATIRAGKSAGDAITVALAGHTVTHLAAVPAADELEPILRGDRECVFAMLALYELMGSEAGVCRGHAPATEDVARALMSHAQTLIEVARRRV